MKPSSDSTRIDALIRRCDLCVVDLDQCINPRFTQTTLGALLLLRSLAPSRLIFLPRLLAGAAWIAGAKLRQACGRPPGNAAMMLAFCRAIRGMPVGLVEETARLLPRLGPQAWRGALGGIAARMPVVLLTFAIEPVARAYGEARDRTGARIFFSWRGTPLRVEGGKVEGAEMSDLSLAPAAKEKALEELLASGSWRRPLVIGHGRDEAMMARKARELGGGSLGLARPRGDLAEFDVIIPGDAWREIVKVTKNGSQLTLES